MVLTASENSSRSSRSSSIQRRFISHNIYSFFGGMDSCLVWTACVRTSQRPAVGLRYDVESVTLFATHGRRLKPRTKATKILSVYSGIFILSARKDMVILFFRRSFAPYLTTRMETIKVFHVEDYKIMR